MDKFKALKETLAALKPGKGHSYFDRARVITIRELCEPRCKEDKMGPCLCGDYGCPSCGPAQGVTLGTCSNCKKVVHFFGSHGECDDCMAERTDSEIDYANSIVEDWIAGRP